MFCSPHPYGIFSSPSRFFRARPRMSPAQNELPISRVLCTLIFFFHTKMKIDCLECSELIYKLMAVMRNSCHKNRLKLEVSGLQNAQPHDDP